MRFFDKIYTNKELFWLSLALFAVLLRLIFGFWADACEYIYSRGLFFIVRMAVDYTVGWLPFASVYLLFVYFCYQVIIKIQFGYKTFPTIKMWGLIRLFLSFMLRFVSKTVVLFFFLWGFNYARTPLETQLNISPVPLGVEQLRQEAVWVQRRCVETRAAIANVSDSALTDINFDMDLERELRYSLVKFLQKSNLPAFGCPRLRWLRPNGLLLGFSSSGVYIPFTAEAHIENALHCSQVPFTAAHELGHAYGWGDEAVCNFLGFVACLQSDYPAIQYSGYLSYWRYVMGELKSLDNDFYKNLRAEISVGMAADLDETYKIFNQYPNFFPTLQKTAYNAYLKSQGVKEGVQSYNRMVLLVAAWRKKEGIL